jgi:outer membrane protein TolC
MRLRTFVVTFLSFMLFLLSVDEATAQAKFFTLNDYLEAALKMNPLINSSKLGLTSAFYQSEAIKKGYLPQIGVNSQVLVAPTQGYDPAITNGGQLAAQLVGSYILYNGGLKNLQVQKASLGIQQGKAGLKKVQADVLYGTAVAFCVAVKEKRELSVLQDNVRLLQEYLALVKELHASGQASESDVLNTSVQLENAKVELESMRNSYRNSLLDLSRESGIPFEEVNNVDTALTVIVPDTVFHDTSNIDIVAADLDRQSAVFDAEIVQSQTKPSISLQADAGALTSMPNLRPGLPNVFGAEVGISFTLPFITNGYYDSQYEAARLKAESVSEQNVFLKKSLITQFAQALNDYRQAKRELTTLESSLSTAEQNFILTRAKYAGGSGSSLEVLNAIQLMNQVRMAIEETKSTILMSTFRMQRFNYTGGLSEGE